ncbi:RagB/SusD family nutrient uptake outer membrane protein [Proteiniphilum sp.]|uniref:RagB/SusD family nutrient uptake outer membrane protein n=1 Tax=Proteiniphilum sp. TaxID=1926877 RepID=UPI002B1FC58F|nr:RagB/SusD family nutrient uptake outer membrane protein [Proteiniphilum sp.]MEA4917206.1 RagB/SusD family nutrient uptake outer membrane protein [Proteiniphilum sp.]
MKTINKIYILVIILFASIVSCDFLDVVPDNIATIDYAFRNRTEAEKYLYTCYSGRPNIGSIDGDPAMNGCDETWQRYIQLEGGWPTFLNSKIARGEQNADNPLYDWFGIRWKDIRRCNIFLENIDKVHDMTEYEKARWIAEVKFLKAYYHYVLFKLYGPIPIMDVNIPVSASVEEVQVYREPVDQVVNYITDLMLEAAADLPDASEIIEGTEAGRVDKLIALTMRAEVLLFAASPLFNGNTDYINVMDSRGVQLFPQEYNENKWKLAADACKEAIDACHAEGKALYDEVASETMNQNEIFQLQTTYRQAICDRWNKELIWGNTKNDHRYLAQYTTPRIVRLNADMLNHCMSEIAPTLKMVDKYYSSNGVPIEEDKDWQNSGWYQDRYKVRDIPSTGEEKYYVKEGEKTVYLHYNREPRFYASIGFDKGIYYGSGYYNFPSNVKYCDFLNKGHSGYQGGSGYSISGYAIKKLHHFKNVQQYSLTSTPEYFPFPILRLADLYLMYAEALNEAEGPSEDVYYYLDLVRERAGLEGVRESWQKYSSNPGKPDTKDGLRKIIQQERTIELAFEGKRFWDIRRWKQISVLNESVQGWNIMGETSEDFYNITTLSRDKLDFTVKDYLWPIKESDLLVNKNLVQNYGW